MGVGEWSTPHRPLIVQETTGAPGPVGTGAENLAPTGIRSRTLQPDIMSSIAITLAYVARVYSLCSDTCSYCCVTRAVNYSDVSRLSLNSFSSLGAEMK
jgi:hypothetical protein